MRLERATIDFNKEMIVAEIGSFLCTPLFATIVAIFTDVPRYISIAAVVGGIVGSSIMFIVTRMWDKKKSQQRRYTYRELIGDLMYLTPVAFVLALILYYPTVYFLSEFFIERGQDVTLSAVVAQLVAFTLIVISLNVYRVVLKKKFGKVL